MTDKYDESKNLVRMYKVSKKNIAKDEKLQDFMKKTQEQLISVEDTLG